MENLRKNWVFLSFLLIDAVLGGVSNNVPTNSEVENMIKFLKDGESQIVLSEANKDVVFVIGNTGAGKSTLVQWLATDNNLTAVDSGRGSADFVIEDYNDKIGKSSINSKTIYPELVIDSETDTAFYDFSGFSDTRSTVNDIATSYFIKKVINHVDRVKIVLVVNHSSVRKGVDRFDLRKLLKHTTELIKNINKYLDGIALIVTKVENSVRMTEGGNYELIEDDVLIDNIGTFLETTKKEIMHLPNNSPAEYMVNRNSIKLLSKLLELDGQEYSKIGIFRRPDMAGLISESIVLTKGKNRIKNIIANNIRYIKKKNDDFGYTVSEKSINDIRDLVKELELSIKSDMRSLRADLNTNLTSTVQDIENLIQLFNESSTEVDSHLFNIQQYVNLLKEKFQSINVFTRKLKKIELPETMSSIIKNASVFEYSNQTIVSHIQTLETLLDFLQKVAGKKYKINIDSIIAEFENILLSLQDKIANCEKIVKTLDMRLEHAVNANITTTLQFIKDHFEQQEGTIQDIFALRDNAKFLYEKVRDAQQANDPYTSLKFLNETNSVKWSKFTLDRILNNNDYFIYLKDRCESIADFLKNEQYWYEFLTQLYNHLSSNDFQTNTMRQSCDALLKSVGKTHEYLGKKVGNTTMEPNLKQCSKLLYLTLYNNITDVTLSTIKINSLSNILDSTINIKLLITCDNQHLKVRGIIVKTSDILDHRCQNMSTKSMDIFASDKIIVDRNIDMTGANLQLNILAPTWEIIGNKKISLDGFPGKGIEPSKADTGDDGEDGLPGNPGGHFMGIGDKFINGKGLTISVNGGDGGAGQSGGDGLNGNDGEVPGLALTSMRYLAVLARARNDVVEDWTRRNYSITIQAEGYCSYPFQYCADYLVMGHNCTDGDNGGCGGLGGAGGHPGQVIIYGGADFSISQETGRSGTPGLGGAGGQAGSPGGAVQVKEKIECIVPYKEKSYQIVSTEHYACNPGITNGICNRTLSYEPENPREFMDKNNIISEYISFLQDNYVSFKKKKLDSFIFKLNILS